VDLHDRVAQHIARHELIPPGGDILCLVSGGADSTCLWHVLRALGYGVSALHVAHGLRGAESEEDARFCRDTMGAEIVDARGRGRTEEELRELRYSVASERLRATGHTASDQVETVLYRLVSSGSAKGIKAKREDGIVRPLLPVWREETEGYCRANGFPFRVDSSNPDTKRGTIREQILPLLRKLHPAADRNLLALAEERPRLPRTLEQNLLALLASRDGSKRIDLGSGLQAVREYDRLWLEESPVPLRGRIRWGPWTIESDLPGLHVRTWRAGDRLAGRSKKVQDLFVNAKVPRSERESWPLVVHGEEVVAVPGVAAARGYEGVVRWAKGEAEHGSD
jgi:tRNA(Ile)-lysidine synthase